MKKLLALSVLLGAASCLFAGKLTDTMSQDPAKVSPQHLSFKIPQGDTDVNTGVPVYLDRIEAEFLSGSKTLKIERVRELSGVPYMDHRTNDVEVTGGEITSGTTFDNYSEAFVGPLKKQSGGYLDGSSVRSTVYAVNDSVLQFYSLGTTVDDTYGFAPCVYYSFPSNALYDSGVGTSPDKWTYLGTAGQPGPHKYVSSLNVAVRDPYYRLIHSGAAIISASGYASSEWADLYTTNVTQESYTTGGGVFYRPVTNVTVSKVAKYNGDSVTFTTNWLNEASDSLNPYSKILFSGVEMPTNLVVDASGTTQPIRFEPGHTVTNFAVWATCSMTNVATLVDATVGTSFSTNFNKDAVLLPKDVIRVSGTAMPTGYIIGIGSK